MQNGGLKRQCLDKAASFRLQGIAAALGELSCTHMEPDLAHAVLSSLGLSVSDLEAAGADAYDMEPLKIR